MFKSGTILWRSVAHNSLTGIEVREITFEKDKNSYIGRVNLEGGSGNFIWEPVVLPNKREDIPAATVYGLVVFIDKLPDPDWTHLIVTGVSKAMKHSYDPTIGYNQLKGGAVFATPAKPYDMHEYKAFRSHMFSAMSQNLNADFLTKQNLTLDVWPNEVRPGHCRLITDFRYKDPDHVLLDYCHIRQLSPAEKKTGRYVLRYQDGDIPEPLFLELSQEPGVRIVDRGSKTVLIELTPETLSKVQKDKRWHVTEEVIYTLPDQPESVKNPVE